MVLATESDINTAKIADMVKTATTCFRYICCLKLKFSSNVTPIFKTEADGVIL